MGGIRGCWRCRREGGQQCRERRFVSPLMCCSCYSRRRRRRCCSSCKGLCCCQPACMQGDIFFYVLLPTIMFDAGYGLDAKV